MEYTDVTQARQDLELKFAQRGVVGDAVNEHIQKVVNSIPAIVRSNYHEDDTIAAAQYVDKYFATLENGQPTTQVPTETTKATTEFAIPASDLKAIQAYQNNTKAQRTDRAAKTRIAKLVGDKPYPGTYLNKDDKMIPNADVAKFESYREKLVDTPENVQAFNQCLEAVKNKTPMAIYIPEEGKWSPRTIGAEITTPADNGTGMVEKTYDTNKLLSFIAFDLTGVIVNDANSAGAKLASVRARKTSKAAASQTALTPRLNIVNRKVAFANPDKHVFASRIKKNGNDVVTKEGTVRSALSFQIYTGKTDKMGEKKTRTIRVPGRMAVPRWERLNPVYEDIFGPTEKQSNIVTLPTAKERQAMDTIINKTLYAIQNNAENYGDVSYQIEQAIQEAAGKAGVAATGKDFD